MVIVQVAPKRWKLEINFTQDAILMLSSMNLPDGIQVLYFFLMVAPITLLGVFRYENNDFVHNYGTILSMGLVLYMYV